MDDNKQKPGDEEDVEDVEDDLDEYYRRIIQNSISSKIEEGGYSKAEEMEEIKERPIKRNREEEEEEESSWTQVVKDKKIKKNANENIELYVACRDKLPKQFALAKLLKQHGISQVIKIKYLSPYKIRVQFESEIYREKMIACQELIEKGWRFQRDMEVNFSHGIIRDVDLNLSEEEIMKSISCVSPAVLSSVNRLKRYYKDGEWVPSETVRLSFRGSYLPPNVYVDDLRIKVDPYVFPVSQCSRCWKLGHAARRCPSDKIICPKCGNNHANCDTKYFECVNCGGNHMALEKTCPAFLKEKRIREIMSEFNCTYKKARDVYIPQSDEQDYSKWEEDSPGPYIDNKTINPPRTPYEDKNKLTDYLHTKTVASKHEASFAEVLKGKGKKETTTRIRNTKTEMVSHLKKNQEGGPGASGFTDTPENHWQDRSDDASGKDDHSPRGREISFGELLARLKDILFLKGATIQAKVQSAVRCCLEWLSLVVVDNMAEWPMLKIVLSYLNG